MVTKIDLYEGSNKQLEKLLNNEVVALKQGFVFTFLASLERLSSRKDQLLAKFPAIKEEQHFGRKTLLKKLSSLLSQQAKAAIPAIRDNIQSSVNRLEKDLSVFQASNLIRDSDRRMVLLEFIKSYVTKASEFLFGKTFEVGMTLQGAAIINDIIEEKFRKEVSLLNVNDALQDNDILMAIKNINGFQPSLFISQKAFETLTIHLINKLLPISLECADDVAHELVSLFKKIENQQRSPFPVLNKEIQLVIEKLIQGKLEPTKEFISNFFEVESGFINTKHPDFLHNATESITQPRPREEKPKESSLPKREQNEIDLIKKMLHHYFEVVKKNVCDYVPKIVLTLLVAKTIKTCEHELILSLYQPDRIDELLKLSEDSQEKLQELTLELENLRECLKLLNCMYY